MVNCFSIIVFNTDDGSFAGRDTRSHSTQGTLLLEGNVM